MDNREKVEIEQTKKYQKKLLEKRRKGTRKKGESGQEAKCPEKLLGKLQEKESSEKEESGQEAKS
jgi:hypothetical protein